jgi:hypothetical protein
LHSGLIFGRHVESGIAGSVAGGLPAVFLVPTVVDEAMRAAVRWRQAGHGQGLTHVTHE